MTIGPAPMMRIDLMSVRLGTLLLHRAHELVEEVRHLARSGARFRVALEAERGLVGVLDALQRAVEERAVRGAHVGRQRLLVHREAVVLARDEYLPGLQVLHRMVRAVVAELHLHGPGASGEAEELV